MSIQTTIKSFLSKATLGLLVSGTMFTACKKDDVKDQEIDQPSAEKAFKEVSGILTGDVKFYADTTYLLKGFVRVGQDDGNNVISTGKLTIEPGTLIFGDRETKGTLVVQRGSQIFAEGDANNPIVFTSERGVGLKQPGDWGGVVICGNAVNNIPGGTGELEGSYGAFHGGTNDDDNSGVFKYVRIEYAGIAINPNQEVNSLTMGSVGSATEISHVQASYGLDDAFEWFGGTVNCTNLIAYRGLDDDFDVDLGYRGNVQFALSIRDANYADQSGSNGFEVDNNGSGSNDQPFTSATFSNVTVVGPKATVTSTISTNFQHALHLRRNNKLKVHNSFFTGYPYGIYIDASTTEANATNGELVMKNNVLAGVESWTSFVPYRVKDGSTFDLKTWFETNNEYVATWQDAGIQASLFEVGAAQVLPAAGSMLLNGASFAGLTEFTSVDFRGAFGSDNWTAGWAEFNPSAKDYNN